MEKFSLLSPYYVLSFDIMPMKLNLKWSCIIHVTKGQNDAVYGDRNPAIWFSPYSTYLEVRAAVSGNKNHPYTGPQIPLYKFTNVKISQKYVNGDLLFQIFIDGILKHSIENTQPMFFNNMTVYAGDPWYEPAGAVVKNYQLKDLLCDIWNSKYSRSKSTLTWFEFNWTIPVLLFSIFYFYR